jgi:cellulose synthase/poly-beta-1,6-N-acetylglucosamine synthase-like glycosyltransferase
MILQIIFWSAVFLIFHTYLLYPFLLALLAKGKEENKKVYSHKDELPFVSILISAHNEEKIIMEKIRSIYYTLYPLNKFEVLIGSDNSTDRTNRICKIYDWNYKDFRFFEFTERQGKPSIINKLKEEAKGEILIITDANVMFKLSTMFELVKHFKNINTGLVDSVMVHKGLNRDGISYQENAYISMEVLTKQREGIIWGTMMGPFGGCYAIRKVDFPYIPVNSLVDDFFVNMKILEKSKDSVNSSSSIVVEDVSNDLSDEFRRKIRIATGNFQNLVRFFPLLFTGKKGLAFSFISHKIIRWLGPFLLATAFISNLLLFNILFYKILFLLQLFVLLLALIDIILKKLRLHIVPLRFITHFLSMNLALFIGFIKFAIGVKSGIWEPNRRNQSE